jgi:Tol biopolymer transport system component/serine/threonine protein kinase
MGIVYKAEDVKLGRRVAMKFLPEEMASDPRALRRFQSEALAISGLDHPNICTIHEVDEHAGRPFLVMQLLEGQTLRELIESKVSQGMCFGNTELLEIAVQIVKGLEAAHQKGMIHRDIKPANIFLTNRGEVKILDFGLAKLIESGESAEVLSPHDPADVDVRLTISVSRTGVAMGTPAYLSPEQVNGEKLDARTDVYSLGLVLYEMATGQRAFEGSTGPEVRKAILQGATKPVHELNTEISPALEQVINRAIRKDRSSRYRDASEMREDLLGLKHHTSAVRTRNWALAAATLGVVLAGVVAVPYGITRHSPPKLPLEFVPLTTLPGFEGAPTFSPDGEQVAFDWLGEPGWNIFTKRLDDEKVLQLTEPPDFSSCPSWSPDGKYIAYLKGTMGNGLGLRSGIYLMGPLGGGKRRILDVTNISCHVSWSPDSRTLVYGPAWSASEPAGLFLVNIDNPVPRRLLTSPPNTLDDAPAFSRDGKKIVFARNTSLGTKDLYVVASSGGEPKRLTYLNANLGGPIWTSDDQRIVFWVGSGWAAIDLYAISATGGIPARLPFATHKEGGATISLDGRKLAYAHPQFDPNIWRVDLSKKSRPTSEFIASTWFENAPDFSRDGSKISFLSDRDGTQAIWICNADGSNPRKLRLTGVTATAGSQGPNIPKWAPSGDRIAYDARNGGHSQIFVVDAEGGTPTQITLGDFESQAPSWSADGEWIYFGSNRTGRYEIWKTSLRTRQTVQVTKQGGFYAEESPDGKFVFFDKPEDDLATWTYVKSGVYSLSKDSGIEKLLISEVGWAFRAGRAGIFYTDNNAEQRPVLKLYRFASGKSETLAVLNKAAWGGPGGIAISPDGNTFLYAQIDSEGRDLMLVKNGSW